MSPVGRGRPLENSRIETARRLRECARRRKKHGSEGHYKAQFQMSHSGEQYIPWRLSQPRGLGETYVPEVSEPASGKFSVIAASSSDASLRQGGIRMIKAHAGRLAIAVFSSSLIAGSAGAQTVRSISTFAHGLALQSTGPDSITIGGGFVWVSYTNGADSTGLSGSSTVVQYDLMGNVKRKFSIAGSVDGLKRDPGTGLIWALQNQDGNSTLTIIDPRTGMIVSGSPFQYAVKSGARGYDDVVFRGGKVYLSYTNPTVPSDPTIQLLENGSNPLVVSPILLKGASGTNLATGKTNQATTQNDPDSLKLTPDGRLMLTSGDDGQLIFVAHPGAPDQSVSFLTLLDSGGSPVSALDDAVFATAERGTFYLADTGNNQVLTIVVDDLPEGSLYASVGSLNVLGKVDLRTGRVVSLVPGLNAPHGLVFVPANSGDDNQQDDREGHDQ
jgi:hypothetical protein